MHIVFFGSGPFALTCLEAVVGAQPNTRPPDKVTALITDECDDERDDIASFATGHAISVLPTNAANIVTRLTELRPDLIVSVACGKILPPTALVIPPLGCINVHASKLPELRGPNPIQWALLLGLPETAVTTLYMTQEVDGGDILNQQTESVAPHDTVDSLAARLALVGARQLIRTLDEIATGGATPRRQDPSKVTYAPRVNPQNQHQFTAIDWTRSPVQIAQHVRALMPWPMATTCINRTVFRVVAVDLLPIAVTSTATAGQLVDLSEEGMDVAIGDDRVMRITQVCSLAGVIMSPVEYIFNAQ